MGVCLRGAQVTSVHWAWDQVSHDYSSQLYWIHPTLLLTSFLTIQKWPGASHLEDHFTLTTVVHCMLPVVDAWMPPASSGDDGCCPLHVWQCLDTSQMKADYARGSASGKRCLGRSQPHPLQHVERQQSVVSPPNSTKRHLLCAFADASVALLLLLLLPLCNAFVT